MKNYKAIAMRCNKEQFESIKPKLEKAGIAVTSIDFLFKYLTNNYLGCVRIVSTTSDIRNRQVHEQWNEKIFLEACGIETEQKFEITKEQILHIEKTSPYSVSRELKEWFPDVFEVELEVGKWYKDVNGVLFFLKEKDHRFYKGHGFVDNLRWYDDFREYLDTKIRLASHQEVETALKNEALNRYKVGDYLVRNFDKNLADVITNKETYVNDSEYYYNAQEDYLEFHGFVVYSKGQWALVLETKTIKEAEELLKELGYGCKIV